MYAHSFQSHGGMFLNYIEQEKIYPPHSKSCQIFASYDLISNKIIMEKIVLQGMTFDRLMTKEEIESKVEAMAHQLLHTFRDVHEHIEVCVIMNGAFMLAADLMRKLDQRFRLHFIRLQSYEGLQRHEVKLLGSDIDFQKFEHRHVVLLDDIIDSGRSIHRLVEKIQQHHPKSVRIVCLLLKPESLEVPLNVWYAGAHISPSFVIGYGMDCHQEGRGLSAIYQKSEQE